MTVYRRPDPVPLPRPDRPAARIAAVRAESDDLSAIAAREIFLAILSGRLGQAIPKEQILGEQLGVSRTVVREAIKGLASKSIVQTRRSRGTVVLDRSTWNMLDADIIAWMRRAGGHETISAELWQALSATLPSLAALAAASSRRLSIRDAARDLHTEGTDQSIAAALCAFHLAIASAAGNPFLASLASKCLNSLLVDDAGFLASRLRRTGVKQHLLVAEAIADSNADMAQARTAALFAVAEAAFAR